MVNGPTLVKQLNINVLGIAGYYTEDDQTQHVIAASTSGDVSEVHWRSGPSQATVTHMKNYGSHLVAIGGFYSSDDNFQHAIPATDDGTLRELYFQPPQLPGVRDPLYHVDNFAPAKGLASFSSPDQGFDDALRHVVVVNQSGNLLHIIWNAQQQPTSREIITHQRYQRQPHQA